MSDFKSVKKGESLSFSSVSKQAAEVAKFYFGAGWDKAEGVGDVDLDIVCAVIRGKGSNLQAADYVYFGNRVNPADNSPVVHGVYLSKDNTTGEGDGDDESIVINTAELDDDVTGIVIGLIAYEGADLHSAPNAHFRVCDGGKEEDNQIADIAAVEATTGDTVLTAFSLSKVDGAWSLLNLSSLSKLGQGSEAVEGFFKLNNQG